MNRTILYVLIAVVIILGLWFVFKKPAAEPGTQNQDQTNNQTSNGLTSLRDLMALGKSQKCTFSSTEGGVVSSGTFYVSGSRMRGDFEMTASGKKDSGHMMSDANFVYIWGDDSKQGLKMAASEDNGGTGSDIPTNEALDMDADYQYDCDPWVAQSSMFVAPADVKFTDLSAITGSTTLPDLSKFGL